MVNVVCVKRFIFLRNGVQYAFLLSTFPIIDNAGYTVRYMLFNFLFKFWYIVFTSYEFFELFEFRLSKNNHCSRAGSLKRLLLSEGLPLASAIALFSL